MLLKKKNKFKPLYKQFIKLRENVQNRKKLLKFKKQKWENLIQSYKKKQKKYRKFKPLDQSQYIVSKYPNKANSYKKRYKNTLNNSKRFRLFYGNLSKKNIKRQIKYILKKKNNKKFNNLNLLFLELFEHRLDTVLYRSKFSISFRNARQLIVHNKILINQKIVNTPSYIVKPGDLITIVPKFAHLIEKNLKNAQIWPIPPKHLSINYTTMEILINKDIKKTNLSINFSFNLNLEKILTTYYRY